MNKDTITQIKQPEFQGYIGVAREDITPKEKIYMKAWGSSTHDIPDGMHRPLYASAMVFDNNEGIEFILLCLDHMFWRTHDEELEIRQSILDDLDIKKEDLILHLSHSHSTPSTAFEHIERPGGEYILPYRERIKKACKSAIHKARENKQLSTLTWAYGSCKLAYDRDYSPPDEGRVLVGLNPEKKADDTILVGRVVDRDNEIIATLVNYACHPVSLGGANKLISPDYVGAMRETVEISTNYAQCIFLHGASGELTPRRSYESDTVIADQNGKEVGYAALSVLHSMLPPAHYLNYEGVEEAGTALAIWESRTVNVNKSIDSNITNIPLRIIESLPSRDELIEAIKKSDESYKRERFERRLSLRETIGDDESYNFNIWIWNIGDAFIIATPAEAHSSFQQKLREHFPNKAIAVLNIANGYLSYLSPMSDYPRNIYQVQVALFESGSLEQITDRTISELAKMIKE